MPNFPSIAVQEPAIHWLDSETQTKVLNAIPEAHRPAFVFMAEYGCRPGEVRALKWDAVNLETGQITIRRTFSQK
jgi:integrase